MLRGEIMKIYRAYYDSRNFSFEAFAAQREDARAILLDGLRAHGEQYGCEPDWFMFGDADGVEVTEYEIGKAYRDRDFI
jgi:hypothetical protein